MAATAGELSKFSRPRPVRGNAVTLGLGVGNRQDQGRLGRNLSGQPL